MSELSWAQNALQENIAPVGTAQYVETRIRVAANALKWTFGRTRTIWYADERASIKPRGIRRIEEVAGIKYGREELSEIDVFIRRADALSMGGDPDFHSAFIAAARSFYRTLASARASRRSRE